jgi:hypothetical protein
MNSLKITVAILICLAATLATADDARSSKISSTRFLSLFNKNRTVNVPKAAGECAVELAKEAGQVVVTFKVFESGAVNSYSTLVDSNVAVIEIVREGRRCSFLDKYMNMLEPCNSVPDSRTKQYTLKSPDIGNFTFVSINRGPLQFDSVVDINDKTYHCK